MLNNIDCAYHLTVPGNETKLVLTSSTAVCFGSAAMQTVNFCKFCDVCNKDNATIDA